jgi:hypothetical protein
MLLLWHCSSYTTPFALLFMLFLSHYFSCVAPPAALSHCCFSCVVTLNTLLLFMLPLSTLFFLHCSSRATAPFTLLFLSRYSFHHVAPLALSFLSHYSSCTITHFKYLLAQLLLFFSCHRYCSSRVVILFCLVNMVIPLPCAGQSSDTNSSTKGKFFNIFYIFWFFWCCCFAFLLFFVVVTFTFLLLYFFILFFVFFSFIM